MANPLDAIPEKEINESSALKECREDEAKKISSQVCDLQPRPLCGKTTSHAAHMR